MSFSRGQISVPVASVGAIVIAIIGWTSSYFGNMATQQAAVAAVSAREDLLCNNYVETVSRIDQNLQNIGEALKVTVVVGASNSNPCKK